MTNVDSGVSDDVLRAMLGVAADDHRAMRGRMPRFQCFHRGGFGSVGWLHVHSFDTQADSICPSMSTAYGRSPNPLPQRFVCADGARDVDARLAQMRQVMAACSTAHDRTASDSKCGPGGAE